MEKINEIVNSIKERLSNPFIFSFLVAWFTYNWKIPVALIWYSHSELKAEGYNGFFDLIGKQALTTNSIVYPLCFAVAYILFNPLIRNLITAFNAWMTKWGSELFFNISKDSKVPTSKFLVLRNRYNNLNKELENVIKGESLYLERSGNLEKRNADLMKQIDILNVDLTNFSQVFNVEFLNGKWEIAVAKLSSGPDLLSMTVNSGTVSYKRFGDISMTGNIVNFYRDTRNSRSERAFFLIRFDKGSNPGIIDDFVVYSFNLYNKVGDDHYEGVYNHSLQMTMKRIN